MTGKLVATVGGIAIALVALGLGVIALFLWAAEYVGGRRRGYLERNERGLARNVRV